MIIRPAVKAVLLRLDAHSLLGDLRHIYTIRLVIDMPHPLLFKCEFFRVTRHNHGLQKKPGVARNFCLIVKTLFHRPVVLPAIGEVNVVNHFAFDQLHERILDPVELVAAEGVTVVVQPFSLSLDGTQADLANNAHRPRGERE